MTGCLRAQSGSAVAGLGPTHPPTGRPAVAVLLNRAPRDHHHRRPSSSSSPSIHAVLSLEGLSLLLLLLPWAKVSSSCRPRSTARAGWAWGTCPAPSRSRSHAAPTTAARPASQPESDRARAIDSHESTAGESRQWAMDPGLLLLSYPASGLVLDLALAPLPELLIHTHQSTRSKSKSAA